MVGQICGRPWEKLMGKTVSCDKENYCAITRLTTSHGDDFDFVLGTGSGCCGHVLSFELLNVVF